MFNQEVLKETRLRTIESLKDLYGLLVSSAIAWLVALIGVALETFQNSLERAYFFLPSMTPKHFEKIYHNDLSNTFKYGVLIIISAIVLFIILMWLQRKHASVISRMGWSIIIIVMGGLVMAQTLTNVYMNHDKGINYYHPERMYQNQKGGK